MSLIAAHCLPIRPAFPFPESNLNLGYSRVLSENDNPCILRMWLRTTNGMVIPHRCSRVIGMCWRLPSFHAHCFGVPREHFGRGIRGFKYRFVIGKTRSTIRRRWIYRKNVRTRIGWNRKFSDRFLCFLGTSIQKDGEESNNQTSSCNHNSALVIRLRRLGKAAHGEQTLA